MTDIQAIKKAVEALMRTLAELRATEPGTVDCENAVGAWRQARRIYMIATGHLQDDPATVLELCRLAEIGRYLQELRPAIWTIPRLGEVVRGVNALGEFDDVRYELSRFWVFGGERKDCGEGFVLATTGEPVDDITHWMPRPESPK